MNTDKEALTARWNQLITKATEERLELYDVFEVAMLIRCEALREAAQICADRANYIIANRPYTAQSSASVTELDFCRDTILGLMQCK